MVLQHLRVGLPLVLSILLAFDTDWHHNGAQNRRLLSNTSSEMGQADGVQERSYLNVVIDLKKNGSFKVIKAARVFGDVILRDFPTSDFIYEASSGGVTLAVAFFPEDPFLVRALGDPEVTKESTVQAESAVIVINIPLGHGSLSLIRKLRLRIFKLRPGTSVTKIDPSVFAELKLQKSLVLVNDLPARTFGRSVIRFLPQKGTKSSKWF